MSSYDALKQSRALEKDGRYLVDRKNNEIFTQKDDRKPSTAFVQTMADLDRVIRKAVFDDVKTPKKR